MANKKQQKCGSSFKNVSTKFFNFFNGNQRMSTITKSRSKITAHNSLESIEFDLQISYDKFSTRETDQHCDSDTFAPPGKCEPKFLIRFLKHTNGSTYLNLRIDSSGKRRVKIVSTVSVIDQENRKFLTSASCYVTTQGNEKDIFGKAIGANLLFEDKVTFLFEFTFTIDRNIDKVIHFSAQSEENQAEQHKITDDLLSLYQGRKFTDLTLVVKDQEFKAHKLILAMRSPVFAAMFDHDTKEKQENRVKIPDVDPEVFDQLLKYIYTGKLPPMDKYAAELLIVADKYQLNSLKSICDESLCSQLSPMTVQKLLALADLHNAPKLKENGLEYFQKNSQETIASLFETNNSELLLKVFRDLSLNEQKK